MDEETIIGIQKMREERAGHIVGGRVPSYTGEEFEELAKAILYEKALEDILNAHTVGKMIEIADRVLKENRK